MAGNDALDPGRQALAAFDLASLRERRHAVRADQGQGGLSELAAAQAVALARHAMAARLSSEDFGFFVQSPHGTWCRAG